MTIRQQWISIVVGATIASSALPALSADKCTDARIGINLAGAGFGTNVPGREGFDYSFPTSSQIAYFVKVGFVSLRLSIMWERLQPEINGPLDQKYLAGVVGFLDAAAANGVDVLIDLHNYSRYRGQLIGSEGVPASAFFDVWQKLARATASHKALYAYGLMNEPYNTGGLWHQVAQSGVDAIRTVDKKHRIYVAGDSFSSASLWEKVNSQPFVLDPMNLEVYEAHTYLDVDSSGKYLSTEPFKDPAILVDERLKPFIQWLAKYGKKGAIGEYGVPSDDPRWFGGVTRLIEVAQANCLPTYVWAGGNWSPGYKLSLRPLNEVYDRLLTKHFAGILGTLK